ncbi:MAG: glycosyltransferase, partial [Schleiferiaceae bacterium]|nr:glycosyltransferase [Schleiferiaceae bacterium]
MDLSIVIVNYNVKEFLTQCLESLYRSETDYTFEVIVVDNA